MRIYWHDNIINNSNTDTTISKLKFLFYFTRTFLNVSWSTCVLWWLLQNCSMSYLSFILMAYFPKALISFLIKTDIEIHSPLHFLLLFLDIEVKIRFLSKQWNDDSKGRKSVNQWFEQSVDSSTMLPKGRASSAVIAISP